MAHVVVLSDIHGNLSALKAVWADIARRPGARIFCLGDLAAFGPDPDEAVKFVRDVVKPEAVIRGNTDRYLVERVWEGQEAPSELQRALAWCHSQLSAESLAYLASLEASHTVRVDDVEVELSHGAPGNDDTELGPATPEEVWQQLFAAAAPGVTFCGHTHVPFRRKVGQRMVINDGSVGFPFDGDQRAAYVRVKVAAGALHDFEVRRVPYPVDPVIARLQALEAPMAATLIKRLRFSER